MADDKTDPTLADVLEELRKIHRTLAVTMWTVLIMSGAITGILIAVRGI